MNINKLLEKGRIAALSLLRISEKEVSVDNEWSARLEKYNRYDAEEAFDTVMSKINDRRRRRKTIRMTVVTTTIAAAAAVAVLFITLNTPQQHSESVVPLEIVIPEHRIMAELSDKEGNISRIDADTKEIALGNEILKNDSKNSSISYVALTPTTATINRLKVPRKGMYRLILQDSTVVTLNSDSYLEYPTVFSGKTREVRLVGEALFEVKRNTASRFIVHTSRGDVTVYGTVFNIKSYDNEPTTNVTLVSGSVTVNNDHCVTKMEPNERAVMRDSVNEIAKTHLAISSDIAWLQNHFDYTDAPLGLVINDLIRCYDVKIELLSTELSKLLVTFYLSKDNTIETVMDVLEKSGAMKVSRSGHTYKLQ
ncbi:MAG: FecR domain-containing protein, partial [Rikenellaceae bacterium]